MAGNRVEELEEKVRELEATVSGLTDELVETKDRLNRIEERVGADNLDDIVEGKPSRAGARQATGNGQAHQQTRQAQPAGEPSSQDAVDEAVEQADGEPEAAADGGKSDEAESEDDSSEQSDDIIVA